MTTLERRLGLPSVIGISIGAMIGPGLFVLPGVAVLHTGSATWMAYVLAGLCVLPAALSKSELSTAMPVSGGAYVYAEQTLGPWVGTVTGLGLWLSLLIKSAFALVGFGAYLRVLTDVPLIAVGLGLLAAIVILNIVGVRKVAQMQVWVTGCAVACLIGLALWGLAHIPEGPLVSPLPKDRLDFFYTVGLVYISYAGVTKIPAIAEEVRDPGRTLPLGMLVSLGFVTVLYGMVTYVLVRVVPGGVLEGDLRPIYSLAESVGGTGIGIAAAALGIVTMTSMANAGLLAASRFPFAMGRDNLLPAPLTYVSPRFLTPVTAILVTGVLMAAAILFLDVEGMAKLASALMIAAFMVVNLAVLVLRETEMHWYKPTFRSPLYPLVQLTGLGIGLGLLGMLGFTGIATLVTTAVLGSLVYFLFGNRRTDRRGVLGQLGPRQELLATPAGDVRAALPSNATVVVPVLGSERAPERLVEIGAALAHGSKVEVVYLTEVPEQLTLESMLEESPLVKRLRQALRDAATARAQDIEFDALVTRDAGRTVHSISRQLHCDWVVMEWKGRTRNRILRTTPLGWLVDHLSCSLALFKDSGADPIREILVLAAPGPHDALVVKTAQDLADVHNARLTFVCFVQTDASPVVKQAEVDYVEQLATLCAAPPARRIVEGTDAVEAVAAITGEYDLLVLGAPPDVRFRDHFFGTPAERLTRMARCSVLRLKAAREQTHRAIDRGPGALDTAALQLGDFLIPGCVMARGEAATKEALFSLMAHAFADALPGITAPEIERALWEREATQNTAVGMGLALPHATVHAADTIYLGVFTTAHPIDYKAPDGRQVDVFFATLGPPSARNMHLRILASLAKLVVEAPLLEELRCATVADDMWACLETNGRQRRRRPAPPPTPAQQMTGT